ncbi:MAG TPA: carbon monoxide dehydrogenase subunit G [Kiloniellales bacterium]|nr:carbon monoxide dehydrogenase subunit G [Kiloniellales bacterium]
MEMVGEQRIPAPRSVVWEALNDPEVLKASIPGCESLERNESGDGFDAKVRAKVGPVNARFGGTVVLSDIVPPESYTISGEGKGGSAGFAKGSAKVQLTEEGSDTLLSYTVDARVGGKLAQLGSRLIDGTARKMADDFFTRFSDIVKERTADDGAMPDAAGSGMEPPPPVSPAPTVPGPTDTELHPAADAAAVEAAAMGGTATAPVPDATAEAAAQVAPQPTGPRPSAPATSTTPSAEPAKPGGLSPVAWIALIVAVVVILLWLVL